MAPFQGLLPSAATVYGISDLRADQGSNRWKEEGLDGKNR